MKTLILLRHAEAGPYQSGNDAARVLTDHGQLQAIATGKWLREQDICLDHYLCSTATHTRQTMTGAFGPLGVDSNALPGSFTERLYNHTGADYLQVIHDLGRGDCLLIVGHNPDICRLALSLAIQPDDGLALSLERANYAPGTASVFDVDIENWRDLRLRHAELTRVFIPD